MSLFESLPFPVGQTWFLGGPVTAAIGTTDKQYEGAEYFTPDHRADGSLRSKRLRKLRVMRCTGTTGVLLPGLLAEFDTTASSTDPNNTEYATRMAVLASGTDHYCYPVDEYLPAAGVTQYDLFYAIIKGPAGVLTASPPANAIAWGDKVGSINGGFIEKESSLVSSGNTVGRALCSCGTSTQQTLLVDVGAGVIGG